MPKRVALRLGQFFASVDPAEAGTRPYGFTPVRFKKESQKTDPNCIFVVSNPKAGDPRVLVRPESIPHGALSIDATEFSGDNTAQFGIKPNVTDGDWGGYEALHGWTLTYPTGPVSVVLVHYDRNGEQYESANLTVVEL